MIQTRYQGMKAEMVRDQDLKQVPRDEDSKIQEE